MKKSLLILFFSFIIHSSLFINYCSAQWVQQNSGTDYGLSRIVFVNSQTGWICGYSYNSIILKTTNSGNNWLPLQTGLQNYVTYDISFINDTIGYCTNYQSSSYNTKVLKTINGGANWSIVLDTTFVNISFYLIKFIDVNTGWLFSYYSMYKTTNAGVSWTVQFPQGNSYYYTSESFINALTGWATSDEFFGVNYYTSLIKTTDGGNIWSVVFDESHNSPSYSYFSVFFINSITGWVGHGADFLKTTNSGNTWVSQMNNFPANYDIRSSFFTDINTGWIAGYNQILKTTNGGNNWYFQSYNQYSGLSKIFMSGLDTGWISGLNGQILHTTNGGGELVGIKPINSETPKNFYLHQNYPNPFNPTSTINYELPQNSKVNIKIYNLLGHEVKQIVDEFKQAGSHTVSFDGTNLASGVYFYKIEAGKFMDSKKMVLMK